ncbi:hypothetical protein I0K15_00260 [Pontivivens ytuae]|uniref:Uncharacterized protein n=1 Tax=Pontivivens ytuae TaxID=2789856 RepID=A0A7S9QDL0_9RHOB|nr:hypothetical protein I0K15_00260 [Pontivivens ytuae]
MHHLLKHSDDRRRTTSRYRNPAQVVADLIEVPEHHTHFSPSEWRKAQETNLMRRDQAVTRKEEAVSRRTRDLDARERIAETQKRRADTVLRTAKQIANGEITSDGLSRIARDTEDSMSSDAETDHGATITTFARAMRVLNARTEKTAPAALKDEFEAIR